MCLLLTKRLGIRHLAYCHAVTLMESPWSHDGVTSLASTPTNCKMLGCGYAPLGSPGIPHTVAPLTQHAPLGEPLFHSSLGYPCPDGVISSQGTESHPFLKILLCAKEDSGRELISCYHQVRHNPHGASLPLQPVLPCGHCCLSCLQWLSSFHNGELCKLQLWIND